MRIDWGTVGWIVERVPRQADAERLRGLVATPNRHGVRVSSRWVIAKMTRLWGGPDV
jgi:hypothetical protein